jgi:hypothetical protein
MDLGGVTAEELERFTLDDAQAGEVECDAREGFKGLCTVVFQAAKTGGGTDNFRIAIGKNGIAPTFASAPYIPVEITSVDVTISITLPVTMVDGDTVQLWIAGDGTGDDVTFSDGYIFYKE